METHEVLQFVLTQVWQVALIAVVVWPMTKTIVKNQPQLAHLLWALVLLKVITPPIGSSPTSVFSWLGSGSSQQQSARTAMANPMTNGESTTSTLTVNSDDPAVAAAASKLMELIDVKPQPLQTPNGECYQEWRVPRLNGGSRKWGHTLRVSSPVNVPVLVPKVSASMPSLWSMLT